MANFDDFLCERQDDICNAAFDLLKALLPECEREKLEWDMSVIAPLVDEAGNLLTQKGIPFCNPFYDGEETPCCESPDKDCPLWDNCPFRREKGNNKNTF